MKQKMCVKNGCVKPEDQFYKQARQKDGLDPYCKECRSEYSKQYALEHREELNAHKLAYYHKNKERINSNRAKK